MLALYRIWQSSLGLEPFPPWVSHKITRVAATSVFNHLHPHIQQLLLGMGHCVSTTSRSRGHTRGAITDESQQPDESQRLRYASFPILYAGLRVNIAFG